MKLWGGRLDKDTAAAADTFGASIRFDQRLYRQDIRGSIAHATMLGEQGILSSGEANTIVAGLQGILSDAEAGKIVWRQDLEDIHMNVEALLTERIGEPGKRLHTGRSRNDQVALDLRIYTMDACDDIRKALIALCGVLLDTAESNLHTHMPGFTHLQKAQPVTLAHHLTAYVQMLLRDLNRFAQAKERASVMPLGSGALAGTAYPLNRTRVAQLLGFIQISENSLDAVSDRDFALDFLSAASICMMHLSRFCEELILWSTQAFGFVSIDDAYATGSSIMPQKKNPDTAELIRGKTGRVFGNLQALLVAMKGLPLAYNKDMQEDKEALFDAHDTLSMSLRVFAGMFKTLTFHEKAMREAADHGFLNATDAADYLVRKGVPFRDAHAVVGRLVNRCTKENKELLGLTLADFKAAAQEFEADVFDALEAKTCVERRNLPGGPAPEAMREAIDNARAVLLDCARGDSESAK